MTMIKTIAKLFSINYRKATGLRKKYYSKISKRSNSCGLHI